MTEDVSILKKKQRILLSKKRKNISKDIKNSFDIVCEKLLICDWFIQSNIISSFFSINSEISTLHLNNFIEKQKKFLCLPVIEENNKGILNFKSYSRGEELTLGKFNVKEPINKKSYLPDIIFVPCLGFDLGGFRMGYGGGYYDKTISYLDSISHTFLTVGFAYDEQKVKNIVRDNFDKKLNYILTEKQLYKIL